MSSTECAARSPVRFPWLRPRRRCCFPKSKSRNGGRARIARHSCRRRDRTTRRPPQKQRLLRRPEPSHEREVHEFVARAPLSPMDSKLGDTVSTYLRTARGGATEGCKDCIRVFRSRAASNARRTCALEVATQNGKCPAALLH